MGEEGSRVVVPVLAGPTAVGKTSLSLELADALGAEILSADSRQVYRGMEVGTAKPTAEQLSRIRHHFIGEQPAEVSYSAGAFAVEAWSRIRDVLDRGHGVLVVGGSTLYLEALQFGLADLPPVPPSIRGRVRQRLATEGAAVLWEELRSVDPRAAARMDPTKSQRIARALEVWLATGRPLSSFWDSEAPPPYRFSTVVLFRHRAELYSRINERVDEMLSAGLVSEVQTLLDSGLSPSAPALRTIGYREVIDYLQGKISLEDARTLIQRNSRRYAKRQLTYFRRFEDWVWVDAARPDAFQETLDTFQSALFSTLDPRG